MSHPPARQTVEPGCLPRHRHTHAYAAVVIAGAMRRQATRAAAACVGDGRPQAWRHTDRTPRARAQVLSLAAPAGAAARPSTTWTNWSARPPAIGRGGGPACAGFRPAPDAAADWPDRLAEALAQADATPLSACGAAGVSRAFSRGFARSSG